MSDEQTNAGPYDDDADDTAGDTPRRPEDELEQEDHPSLPAEEDDGSETLEDGGGGAG